MRDYVDRGIGNTAFRFHLGRILDALGTIVFALNERYDPATKRVEQAYATMNRLPRDFLTRYNRSHLESAPRVIMKQASTTKAR